MSYFLCCCFPPSLSFAFALQLASWHRISRLHISHDQYLICPTIKLATCAPSMIVLVARFVAKLNMRWLYLLLYCISYHWNGKGPLLKLSTQRKYWKKQRRIKGTNRDKNREMKPQLSALPPNYWCFWTAWIILNILKELYPTATTKISISMNRSWHHRNF